MIARVIQFVDSDGEWESTGRGVLSMSEGYAPQDGSGADVPSAGGGELLRKSSAYTDHVLFTTFANR